MVAQFRENIDYRNKKKAFWLHVTEIFTSNI